MKTIEALTLIADKRISNGDFAPDVLTGKIPNYDLNADIHRLFGKPEKIITEFNNKFEGRTTPELIDLLMRAGTEALETEAVLARYKYYESGLDLKEMLYADRNLKKACLETRRFLSEKIFCIESALGELRSFKKDFRDFVLNY